MFRSSWCCRLECDKSFSEVDVVKREYEFDIFITDLTDEARQEFEDMIGNKEHNYDTMPLATVYYTEEDC